MHTITIINNGVAKRYETEATTFGQLKEVIINDFPLVDQMQGVVRGTDVTLQINSAQLPEGDAFIFLMPKKTDSGADDVSTWNRGQCYDYIKTARTDDEDAKEFFGTYSSRSTTELREMIEEYISSNKNITFDDIAEMLNAVYKLNVTGDSLEQDMISYTESKSVIAEEAAVRARFSSR